MNKKKSDFDKVFSAWDILVIAFGAMIGWGWVVSTGGWIEKGGVVGAALGFAIGGVMIFFVGLTYAELTAAMPQCGGEHVFSHRAMGPVGSFVCTWAIILGYVGVTCFEACAFPTIITYLWPGFLKGYLYTVAGFDIYASWLIVAIVVAFLIMVINIMGAKTAAILQTILTVIIGGAGILLIIASVLNGTVDNLDGQIFAGTTGVSNVKAVLGVAVLSPFYFIGFDVIPQASEEINVPPKKIVRYSGCRYGSGFRSNCSSTERNRTCNSRCDGCGIPYICYGKGNYCWRNVWNYYIMEFVYDRRITCNVFHGRVLYDTKNVFKTASKT